jgi:hypothetical protein
LIAPTRHNDAAIPLTARRSATAHDLWRDVPKIRQEWLSHGLSTLPADRPAAEHHLSSIYARLSRPRPRFTWVASPSQALALVAGWPTLDQLYASVRNPQVRGKPPLASDLAMLVAQLRGRLSAAVTHTDPELSPTGKGKKREPWPELPPLKALDAGVPLGVVLHQGLHTALYRSLARGFRNPIRSAMSTHGPVPVCWYGQQEANWIAYYDTLHRLGLAQYAPADLTHLDEWAALTRSCGWWWAGEHICVVVDRPEYVGPETIPGALHDEVRLTRTGVRYRDGWSPLLA